MSRALLDRLKTDQVVLDFSDQVRQQILGRGALRERLLELSDERVVCFVLREFLQGETGLITRACDDGSTTCEWSSEGLLAINRGIAGTQRARGDERPEWARRCATAAQHHPCGGRAAGLGATGMGKGRATVAPD